MRRVSASGRSARRREKVIFTRILGRRSVGLSACCAWRRYLMLPASACSAFTAPVGRNGTFPRSAAAWRHLSAWQLTQALSPATKTRRGIWGRYRAPVPGAA